MSVSRPLYLDNHATTPCDPRVLAAMLPFFAETFGNPASVSHPFGWEAEAAVDRARAQVARALGAADPKEIVFTSGATESDNLAVKGVAELYAGKGDHIVTVVTEHKAVLDACRHLEKRGVISVTYLPIGRDGLIDLDALSAAITDRTVLVSVMAANNEIGVLQPLARIGALCRERGVLFHTDAAQAFGKVPLDVEAMNLDLVSLTAHKIYGPKGVGALYVRRRNPRVRLAPQMDGGGHEGGFRSGTLNVPGIVALGTISEIALTERDAEAERCRDLRERLRRGICEAVDGVHLNGHPTERLPGSLSLSFEGIAGDSLLIGLKDIALSAGSACSSGSPTPSYVLKALGQSDDLAYSVLRFGIGRFNTEAEIDYTVERVVTEVKRLRALSLPPALAAC